MLENLNFLIADIDGTIVNEAREMLPLTAKILIDLHERGVRIGIASGRPLGDHLFTMVRDTWKLGYDPDCFIGMNGGQLADNINHSFSEFYKLEPDTIRDIITLMKASGIDANPFIYIGEDMLSERRDARMEQSMKRHGINCETVNDLSEFWKDSAAKILFRLAEAEDMPKLEAYLSEHADERFVFFKTQPTMMEFQDPRVNKGVAMRAFCADEDIPMDTVIAFGDMTNDNEMLDEAGWGVCLINGSDDTKACADEITALDNDHEGLAHYMCERWYIPAGWEIPD